MNNNKINILLIEDELFDVRRVENTVKLFKDRLQIVQVVSNGKAALEAINKNPNHIDLIIMDYQIAGALRGEELIKNIKNIDESLQIIVITKLTIDITDLNFAKKLMDAGAFWYCTKYPNDIEEFIYQPTDFIVSIFNAYEKRHLQRISQKSRAKLQDNVSKVLNDKQIIGNSPLTNKLLQDIEKLAKNDVTVLISGPSGTGKELAAANIHYRSKRKYENFVTINCGSIPHELIESELFGYERGAFTGAQGKKEGLFEIANNGTLFLDEVGELPLNAQVKLLRVIQEGEIDKIGRTKSINVNVRIIAATNKDLRQEVEEKRFREDLYYRLNVLPLELHPLVDRKDDILELVQYYLTFYSSQMGKLNPKIEQDAYKYLYHYAWPGNVRQLKNVVQRLLFYSYDVITLQNVSEALGGMIEKQVAKKNFDFSNSKEVLSLKEIEKEFRTEYFQFVRSKSESDADAAKKLGLAPPNYHRMCKELGLK